MKVKIKARFIAIEVSRCRRVEDVEFTKYAISILLSILDFEEKKVTFD